MRHKNGMVQSSPSLSSAHDDIATARRVLALERAGLEALAAALDHGFAQAVALMAEAGAQGRVIVSGMGKSGHIGAKIAATLASTGTPAQFVHPAEASHGDLGMIRETDAVLALSASGESRELADLIAYTRRYAIPLIAITTNPDSTLGSQADVVLSLPKVAEACPMGLAPTTSTTATLALGDCLAVALLTRRGFTSEDFRLFHPGGKLGQKLRKVADLMHTGETVPLVDAAAPMTEVLVAMTAKGFGCAGIVGADGALRGIITDGDLRRHMGDGLLQASAETVMTANPRTITPTTAAGEALRLMNERAITSLFVVNASGVPVGILHIHDCLRAGVG